MLFIILYSLLSSCICQDQDNCLPLVATTKLYIMKSERILHDVTADFRGYNLTYSIKGIYANNYTIQQPIRVNNVTEMMFPLGEEDDRLCLDILLDGNLAWRDEASSLVRRNGRLYVQFAHLSKLMHLEFYAEREVPLQEGEQCYSLVTIATGVSLLDCQILDAAGSVIDFHLVMSFSTDTPIIRSVFHELSAFNTSSTIWLRLRKKNWSDPWINNIPTVWNTQ